ncbi:hypothetical protein FQA47_024971 [Oryzias melastigma]|uniref:Uncharacterized protein n=1 Tax=Oryzias melastigma TaxID=30732 RepID=A0A834F1T0_ORYME|nr:hypothetical protein FQA47_024971 [Oryzias melastigma]
MLTAFFEQIGGKLVSKHRCFGAALPTLSGTTTNKSSYAWLNESPPLPAPAPPPPPRLCHQLTCLLAPYSFLPAKPSFWIVSNTPLFQTPPPPQIQTPAQVQRPLHNFSHPPKKQTNKSEDGRPLL